MNQAAIFPKRFLLTALNISVFLLKLLAVVLFSISSVNAEKRGGSDTQNCSESKGSWGNFAVVELFTSQGCSSCPKADEILAELSKMYPKKKIYPLSFHVTYWDYIGWKDPYGNEEFSKRQERYAKAIPTRLYTPQVVLNGSRDYVGSNRSAIFYSLDASLQERKEQEAKYILNLKSKLSSDSVEVSYSLPCSLENLELQFALVEKGITNSVKRGENAGKTLQHENVVRRFQSLKEPFPQGSISMDFSQLEKNASHFAVIVYLQDPQTMKILAANYLALK